MFVAVEGIEACGKSTLLAGIAHAACAGGDEPVVTREPGGTPAGDAMRAIFISPQIHLTPAAELMLINASRAQLCDDVIRPALQQGKTVLCDRYVYSTLAYQGYGRGLPLETVRAACEAATRGLMPDIAFFVDVAVATSRRRVASRGNALDRLEREADAFYERVRAGFIELARTDPRLIRLDGERGEEEVLDAALAALSAATL